ALIVALTFALINVQSVYAADLQSFSELDTENIKLVHKDFDSVEDYNVYSYQCSPNTAKNFMKRYATRLVSSGLFKISAQFVRNIYGSTFDVIQFKYIGPKKISKFATIATETSVNECNLQIFRIISPDTENLVTFFMSPDLDYAEEATPPVSSEQPAPIQTTPAQNPPATNDGADVPDLEQFDGVVYHHNQRNGDRSITYIFHAHGLSESAADDLTTKYIQLLTGSYNFVQTGYDKKKFNSKRVQANRQSETWTFDYNGSKSISGLSDGNALTLKRIRNPQTGDTNFEIRVAKDLVFAGNYEAPNPPPPGKTFCSACGGSGKCSTCDGKGYYSVGSDYEQPCGSCLTTGNCSDCNGTGYR
ncbi:MAG: hypothetical protein IJS69_03555, partial [Selenomonadaceae bacterium]|nr:hypothetical protein [Selenomonadaceae bacterium]